MCFFSCFGDEKHPFYLLGTIWLNAHLSLVFVQGVCDQLPQRPGPGSGLHCPCEPTAKQNSSGKEEGHILNAGCPIIIDRFALISNKG